MVNQRPKNAILSEGIYNWAISVQPLSDNTNEIRFFLEKDTQEEPYIFSGISIDTSQVTTTFNGICFGLLEQYMPDSLGTVNITGMRISNVSVYLGDPIDVPGSDFAAPVVLNPLDDLSFPEDSGDHIVTDDVRNVFSEPDSGDVFSYTASSNISGLSCWINDYVLTIKADTNFFGSGSIKLYASNSWGSQAIDTILVNVAPVNDL